MVLKAAVAMSSGTWVILFMVSWFKDKREVLYLDQKNKIKGRLEGNKKRQYRREGQNGGVEVGTNLLSNDSLH